MKIAIPIIAGALVLLTIVGLSTLFFGDETNTESIKPLWVIIPILGLLAYYLISSFKKK
jgi:hypothetical protein